MGPSQSAVARQSAGARLDLSNLPAFRRRSPEMQCYLQHCSDGQLAMAKCVSDLSVKFGANMTIHMTKEERAEFLELQVEKEKTIDDVANFIGVEVLRYGRMKARVTPGVLVADIFQNSLAGHQIEICEHLLANLTTLKRKFIAFKESLEVAMKADGRCNEMWFREFEKWCGVFTKVAYSVGAITLIILHLVPAVNVGHAGVEFAQACMIAMDALGAAVVVSLQKDEVDRAVAYIDNITENLHQMKISLEQVQHGNMMLGDRASAEEFILLLEQLEERASATLAVCDQARQPA